MDVECDKEIFGAQPFLAFQSFDDVMYHDNFSYGNDGLNYFYVFDEHSIPIRMIKKIGIATNDKTGNSTVCRVHVDKNMKIETKYIK